MQSQRSLRRNSRKSVAARAIKSQEKADHKPAAKSVEQPELQPSPSPTSPAPVSAPAVSASANNNTCEACAVATMACALHQQGVFYVPHAADAGLLFDFLGNEGELLISGPGDSATVFDTDLPALPPTAYNTDNSHIDVITEEQYRSFERHPSWVVAPFASASSSSSSDKKKRTRRAKAKANSDTDSHSEYGSVSEQEEEEDDDEEEYEVETKARSRRRSSKKGRKRALTSKYHGVCWYKRTQRWVCQIKVNGKRQHIGYFVNEDDAGAAYNKALRKLVKSQDARTAEGGAPKARKRTFNNTPKRHKGNAVHF